MFNLGRLNQQGHYVPLNVLNMLKVEYGIYILQPSLNQTVHPKKYAFPKSESLPAFWRVPKRCSFQGV